MAGPSILTIEGDQAKVVALLDGLVRPAIEPSGGTLWVGKRGADQAIPIPLPP